MERSTIVVIIVQCISTLNSLTQCFRGFHILWNRTNAKIVVSTSTHGSPFYSSPIRPSWFNFIFLLYQRWLFFTIYRHIFTILSFYIYIYCAYFYNLTYNSYYIILKHIFFITQQQSCLYIYTLKSISAHFSLVFSLSMLHSILYLQNILAPGS